MDTQQSPVSQEARGRAWAPRIVFGLAMFLTGAAGLIYEYVLSTQLSYLLGSSIKQFSVTIGIMFFTMGIGGWVQKLIRSRLAECFLAAELLLVVLGGFSSLALHWSYVNLPDDFGWIKFVYPAMIGLLTGMEIPLMMRINKQFAKNLESNIAGVWAWDYIGGAVGVLAWMWMLISYTPITMIAFAVAGCNLLVSIVTLVFFWRHGLFGWKRRSGIGFSMASLVIGVAMSLGIANVNVLDNQFVQALYDDPVVLREVTPYQEIVMTRGPHPTDPRGTNDELYLNGNKQFASADEAIYHEHLVHPVMNTAASRGRVLILGGGDGMALREVLKYKDVRDVTLVDLDPGMIKLASTNPLMRRLNNDAFADARVVTSAKDVRLNAGVSKGERQPLLIDTGEEKNVRCEEVVGEDGVRASQCSGDPVYKETATVNVVTIDADRFASSVGGPYDVIIVDLPDPNSVELAKLYSKEFYSKLRRILSPDGAMVVQATSPYHARETFLCIQRTMHAADYETLLYHANVPSFGDWGWILASPSLSQKEVRGRVMDLKSFGVPTRMVKPANVRDALGFYAGGLSANNTRISTVTDPVVFGYYENEAWLTD